MYLYIMVKKKEKKRNPDTVVYTTYMTTAKYIGKHVLDQKY